jgi:hypothetical protein
MKTIAVVLCGLFFLQGQTPKRTLVHRSAEKFWEVQGVKETELVYSERYSDDSGFDADFSFTIITITPQTIVLSGYGLNYGKTVTVAENELAGKLSNILKTKAERVLIVVVEPTVSAHRLLSVLAICQPELNHGFLFPQKNKK